MPGIESSPLSEAELKALSGDMSGLPADYLADMPNLPAEGVPEPEKPAAPISEEAAAPDAEKPADEPQNGEGDPAAPAAAEPKKNVESVPLAVFMEEKKGKQELERRLNDLSVNFERANARLEMIMKEREKPADEPAKPAMPDPDQDFMGAARYAIDRVKQLDAREAEIATEQQRQDHNRRVQNEVVQGYGRVVEERVAQDPSFADAQNYLINSRYQELLADGYGHDAAVRQVHSEEFSIALNSFQRRINPADRIVALAKARGWNPQPATPPAPAADPAAEAAAKLETIKQGQEASASLSSAGASGAGKSGKVDMKALGDMSDDDFKDWLEKNGDKGFRKVVGG